MMKCFDARNNRGKRLWIERKDIHLIVHRALELLIWSKILIVINFLEIEMRLLICIALFLL